MNWLKSWFSKLKPAVPGSNVESLPTPSETEVVPVTEHKPPKLPTSISDFEEIIREGYFYVDKSLLIQEIWEDDSTAMLILRPRRFGKSLNMHMLRVFFEQNAESKLAFANSFKPQE